MDGIGTSPYALHSFNEHSNRSDDTGLIALPLLRKPDTEFINSAQRVSRTRTPSPEPRYLTKPDRFERSPFGFKATSGTPSRAARASELPLWDAYDRWLAQHDETPALSPSVPELSPPARSAPDSLCAGSSGASQTSSPEYPELIDSASSNNLRYLSVPAEHWNGKGKRSERRVRRNIVAVTSSVRKRGRFAGIPSLGDEAKALITMGARRRDHIPRIVEALAAAEITSNSGRPVTYKQVYTFLNDDENLRQLIHRTSKGNSLTSFGPKRSHSVNQPQSPQRLPLRREIRKHIGELDAEGLPAESIFERLREEHVHAEEGGDISLLRIRNILPRCRKERSTPLRPRLDLSARMLFIALRKSGMSVMQIKQDPRIERMGLKYTQLKDALRTNWYRDNI